MGEKGEILSTMHESWVMAKQIHYFVILAQAGIHFKKATHDETFGGFPFTRE